MIKIGDFARLSQVSVVTLRHYDDINLFKPISVDPFTGYRYYSIHQLARLNRILALKDLGFTLEQIEHVLSGITLEELRGMLKLRHAEQTQRLAEETGRLERIATRLKYIELEDKVAEYDVVLKTVPPMLVASCKVTIPTNDQVPQYLDTAYHNLWNFIKEHSLKTLSPHMTLWHQAAEVVENEVVEAMIVVDRKAPNTVEVQVYTLPETRVVSFVHHGNFDGFQIGHTVLLKWIEENGYRVGGGYRELYLKHDPTNLNDSTTEIQYPIES